VRDDVHDGARVTDAFGDTDGDDGEARVDRFVGGDALQIGVNDAARDRMPLDLSDEHGLALAAAIGERDDRISSGAMKQFVKSMGVERQMLGDGAMTVEHGWDFSGRTERLRSGRTELGTLLDGELELFSSHGFLYKRGA
jgi:hypothetical protein